MYRLKSLVTVPYMNEMNLPWTLSFYSSLNIYATCVVLVT